MLYFQRKAELLDLNRPLSEKYKGYKRIFIIINYITMCPIQKMSKKYLLAKYPAACLFISAPFSLFLKHDTSNSILKTVQ